MSEVDTVRDGGLRAGNAAEHASDATGLERDKHLMQHLRLFFSPPHGRGRALARMLGRY